ncbi:MAG: tRNA lysidine(34) synthetase TilS [Bacteroidales bacterium]|nr:tRNA lysidine(34) synthetase TilS [Bacteroidales bacterium]
MLQRFKQHITEQHLFGPSDEVLLAVSGGIDSSAMCHLMHSASYRFAIAHCNFNLRPGDCDRDQQFVKEMAHKYGVAFYTENYDTKAYATQNHLSIEEAARNLRYDFFERLRQQYCFAAIATAHHRDDSAETFFINLIRGTGIAGLHGITCRSGYVVRPMLCFSRTEIADYSKRHNINYVTDYTNNQPLYLRNRIRLELMPLLRTISPNIDNTMQRAMQHLADTETVYRTSVDKLRQNLLCTNSNTDTLPIAELITLNPRRTLLFELLRPYGFNAATVADIETSLNTQPGKIFVSPTHRLLRDRTYLVIEPLNAVWPEPQIEIVDVAPSKVTAADLHCSSLTAYFDADRLQQPLNLRPWREADRFVPFGMNGTRLVSDMLTDAKLNLFEKERVRVLCDAQGQLLWLVGLRTANPVRLTNSTQHALRVTVSY